jgi:hypothetical protein
LRDESTIFHFFASFVACEFVCIFFIHSSFNLRFIFVISLFISFIFFFGALLFLKVFLRCFNLLIAFFQSEVLNSITTSSHLGIIVTFGLLISFIILSACLNQITSITIFDKSSTEDFKKSSTVIFQSLSLGNPSLFNNSQSVHLIAI